MSKYDRETAWGTTIRCADGYLALINMAQSIVGGGGNC